MRWGSGPLAEIHHPLHAGTNLPAGVVLLVLSVKIDVNDLARQGRDFPWHKPSACPHCGLSLWWHGFVLAYFATVIEAVFLRRLYCPHCQSVHRLRPSGYWQRFRSSEQEIFEAMDHRTHKKRWRPDLPRSRQRQWWRRLGRLIRSVLGVSFVGSMLQGFSQLIRQGLIPVSSAAKNENRLI
jgi:hypothetical protein